VHRSRRLRPVGASVGFAAAPDRAWWIAGLVTFALAGASSGVALAGPTLEHAGLGTYILTVSVEPTTVPGHKGVLITARGHTPLTNRVELEVYATRYFCQPKASDEAENPKASKLILKEKVEGRFSRSVNHVVAVKGEHRACGYLFKVPDHTLARGHGSWKVV
jgi:hypothetical protein